MDTTIVREILFFVGMSLFIKYEIKRVIAIHRKESITLVDNHNSWIKSRENR